MLNTFLDYSLRHLRWSITIAVVAVLVIVSIIWWSFIWQSPQRVFTDMLTNGLETTSVTKHLIASTSSQSVNQYVRLEMGSTNATDWVVTATQSNTSVTSDSIGTLTTGYIRYTDISTQPGIQTKSANYKNVLDVWGKADGKTDVSLGQLFSNTLLDISNAPIPPIGNVTDAERRALVNYDQNQNVFEVNYNQVKSASIDGQAVYDYPVAVHLGPYVRMMQSFAHSLGITSLESIDANQYSTLAPVDLTLSVNKVSHQLVEIYYPTTGFAQSYSDWGLLTPIPIPLHSISTTALQNRIQSLQ